MEKKLDRAGASREKKERKEKKRKNKRKFLLFFIFSEYQNKKKGTREKTAHSYFTQPRRAPVLLPSFLIFLFLALFLTRKQAQFSRLFCIQWQQSINLREIEFVIVLTLMDNLETSSDVVLGNNLSKEKLEIQQKRSHPSMVDELDLSVIFPILGNNKGQ